MYLTVYVVCTFMYTCIFRQDHSILVNIIGTAFVQQHNNAGIDLKNLNFHVWVPVYGWSIHPYMIVRMYASYIHACIYICAHPYTHTWKYACMYECVSICMNGYGGMQLCTDGCIQPQMHWCMDTYIHAWMDGYIHPCIYVCASLCLYIAHVWVCHLWNQILANKADSVVKYCIQACTALYPNKIHTYV